MTNPPKSSITGGFYLCASGSIYWNDVSILIKRTFKDAGTAIWTEFSFDIDKRPTDLNGHLSIRDFILNSCQKGAYLDINSPIIITNKNQQLYKKTAS